MQQRLKQSPRSAWAKVVATELFNQLNIARAPCARHVSRVSRRDSLCGAWTTARKHGWSRGSRRRVIVASCYTSKVGGAGGTRTRLSGSTIRQLHPWPTAPCAAVGRSAVASGNESDCRLPTCRLPRSSLHAHHLSQRVHDV